MKQILPDFIINIFLASNILRLKFLCFILKLISLHLSEAKYMECKFNFYLFNDINKTDVSQQYFVCTTLNIIFLS